MRDIAARANRWRRAPIRAAVLLVVLVTGVALATPVPVLSLSDGGREYLAPLDDGEALVSSYRQSIYEVPVYEDFVRRGDDLDLLRVRSPDIRAIEYFRWEDGEIVRNADGLWSEDAPRPNAHRELTLRIAPLGQQRISTVNGSYALLPLFGETVVTVRVAARPRAQLLLEAAR